MRTQENQGDLKQTSEWEETGRRKERKRGKKKNWRKRTRMKSVVPPTLEASPATQPRSASDAAVTDP